MAPILVTLTGGGDAEIWNYTWALVHFSASGLQLQFSFDDGSTYVNAIDVDGNSVLSTGSGMWAKTVLLPPGCLIKATGSGTVIVMMGRASIGGN